MVPEHENVGKLIRATHPYGYRTGEWAEVRMVVPCRSRYCYLVEFPDKATDLWPVFDPDEHYEFREKN